MTNATLTAALINLIIANASKGDSYAIQADKWIGPSLVISAKVVGGLTDEQTIELFTGHKYENAVKTAVDPIAFPELTIEQKRAAARAARNAS